MLEKIDYLNEIENTVGSERYEMFSLGGISLPAMNVIELSIVLELVKEIQLRKTKNELKFNRDLANQIFILMNRDLSFINVFGLPFERMDQEEMRILIQLIEVMKLRAKGYKIVNGQFESHGKKASMVLNGDKVEVTMEYHPYLIEKMGSIPSAEFKKAKKRWEFHISQWLVFEEKIQVTQLEMVKAYERWKEENSVNRLRLTTQGCYLTGINLPIQEIHYATSFPDLNAKHMPSFQNGSWDGRIALYDKGTGFLPYGLLGKVLNILKQRNIPFEYKDERVRPTKHHDFQMNVNLRDYQDKTLNIALQEGRGILQLATGAGKTKTASAIVSTYGLNTIFFVHTKFLLGQAKEALEEVLGEKVGQVGDGIVDIRPVTVAMVQTTMRALGEEYKPSDDDMEGESGAYIDETDISKVKDDIVAMLDNCELIFFDECQFVAAETFYKIANRCNAYYKYGLSATPYRSDKKDLMIEAALGPVIDRINASYLIERGFLTRPNIHFFKVGSGVSQQEDRNYQQVYRDEIVENLQRNTLIVKSTKKMNSKNRSVLILVQQVNHGKLLQELFNQEGMDVEFVYGMDNMDKRDLEVYKLRTKKKLALIATTIADEGLDVPSLDAVILGGGGKSPSKGMQRVGRAIRIFGEREEAFEIFMSTKQILNENKNVLITVESIEKGKYVQEFFASVDQSRGKQAINVPFYFGEDFTQNKKAVLDKLASKEIPAMIVLADNITEEECMEVEPLDSILISVGEKFDANKIQKMPSNVLFRQLEMTLSQLTPAEIKEGKKPKELFTAENFGFELINPEVWNKKVLILVDETRHANAIKDFFKIKRNESGVPIEEGQGASADSLSLGYIPQPILVDGKPVKLKYLTGEKSTEKIKPNLLDVINGKQNVLMINSAIIKESIDFHLFDYVFVISDSKPAYVSRELVQKDVRIFTKKEEAYVVDFIDNVKYCFNHSLERKLMFETESAFKITGWS